MAMFDRDSSSIIVKLAVGIVLLGTIVAFVDVDKIISTAKEADFLLILAALALLPINMLLEAAKWRLLLAPSVERITLREAAGSVLAGYALGFVTPARFGEYAGRVFYLKDARKGALVVLAFVDRMYSVWIYSIFGTVILGFQLEGALPGPGGIWWLTFALGIAICVVIGVFVLKPGTLFTVSGSLLKWRATRRWRRHLAAARSVQTSVSLNVLLLSLIRYGVFCTQFVALVLAFSPTSPVASVYAGVALAFFAKTIVPSVSLFDLGIRESAAVFFLGFFGIASAAAFNASLILFVVNLALPALAGIAFVPRMRWTRPRPAAGEARTVEVRTG